MRQWERGLNGRLLGDDIATGYATWSSSESSVSITTRNNTIANEITSLENGSASRPTSGNEHPGSAKSAREPWKRHRYTNSNGSIGPQNLPKPAPGQGSGFLPNTNESNRSGSGFISESGISHPGVPISGEDKDSYFATAPNETPGESILRRPRSGRPPTRGAPRDVIPKESSLPGTPLRQSPVQKGQGSPVHIGPGSQVTLGGSESLRTESPTEENVPTILDNVNDSDFNQSNIDGDLNRRDLAVSPRTYVANVIGDGESQPGKPGHRANPSIDSNTTSGFNSEGEESQIVIKPEAATLRSEESADDIGNIHGVKSTENLFTTHL